MLSPTELQEARRKAADRYFEIGMAHLPEGWTHEFRKSLTGMCHGKRKYVTDRPVTRKSLYIWLHECAHAHLHFGKDGKRRPRHVEEMEAEQWAHARMREHGIAVPRSMTARAQAYVARKIKQAEARGAKSIDPAARRYARIKK